MTEPAQIRLTIDPDLRNGFKAACVLSGISMADQTAQLIARFVGDEMIDDDSFAERNEDEPAEDDAEAQPSEKNSLADLLYDKLAPIADALSEVATHSNISWLYDQQGKDIDRRNDALAKSIDTIGTKVAREIESSHSSGRAAPDRAAGDIPALRTSPRCAQLRQSWRADRWHRGAGRDTAEQGGADRQGG